MPFCVEALEIQGAISEWREREAKNRRGLPAGWVEMNIDERLAKYLVSIGFVRMNRYE